MIAVEVFDCHRRASTIPAIKYLLELRSLNLREAKDLVDAVYFAGQPIVLEFTSEPEARAFAEQMTAFRFSCRFVAED